MYESPINQVVNKISSEMKECEDDQLMCKIRQAIGYDIDKTELVRALQYDRQQYEKGYTDGLNANKWIPVSERLPEEEKDVLVCNANGDVEISSGSYSTEMKNELIWYTSGWRFGKVIAWQPLPQPYKEDKE